MISRLILVQPEARAIEALRFGFEREGIAVEVAEGSGPGERELAEPTEVIVVGGRSKDEALALLARVRGALAAANRKLPVLYVGNGIARTQALAEGATEFLGQPAFVRDVVTVAKLLAGRRKDNPAALTGDLSEHFGLFYLVRAIASLRRRGVLTIVRGLRRGELRFYDGEVTSAQVGMLHGLAAMHQLLLWTEGRFELRPENVVRRRQIPLEPGELLDDCERFLQEIRQVAGALSPSSVFERNEAELARLAGQLPDPVDAVLRLFDGSRSVADVIEDSPFRVFETLKIAGRLRELEAIRLGSTARPRHRAHAALAIEEWLVGSTEAAASAAARGKSKTGEQRALAPVDWSQYLPSKSNMDLAASTVVPSTVAAGEISVANGPSGRRASSQAEPTAPVAPTRERIEEVAAPEALSRLFSDGQAPTTASLEPVSATGAREKAFDSAHTVPFERVALSPDDDDTNRLRKLAVADEEPITDKVKALDAAPVVPAPAPAAVVPAPAPAAVVPAPAAVVPAPAAVVPAPAAVVQVPAAVVQVPAAVVQVPAPAAAEPAILGGGVPIVGLPISDSGEVPALKHAVVAKEPVPATASKAKPAAAKPADAKPGKRSGKTGGEKALKKGKTGPIDKLIAQAEDSFTADEEAFFEEGHSLADQPRGDGESFEDLDEGYVVPKTFWQRLFSRPGSPLKRRDPPGKR